MTKSNLPAPTPTELDAAFDALEVWIRDQPLGMVSFRQLADYERREWCSKWRPERRVEKNRISMFVSMSGRVQIVHVVAVDAHGVEYSGGHARRSSATWVCVPGTTPTAPAGHAIKGLFPAHAGLSEDRGESVGVSVDWLDRPVMVPPCRRTAADCLAI